ncbi:MAG TPA: hypothetical protein VN861_02945 [Candidatus Acidoferrales bacterium]|nr:hypothetical protein [Candidatus Acidoferrales bacterium]
MAIKSKVKYRVTGNRPFGVSVIGGGLEYDLIYARKDADIICGILNEGIGPEWDDVEPEFNKRKAGR